MDSSPAPKKLFCVYNETSGADDNSPSQSGKQNNMSSSSSKDMRLSNKLQEARMRRQFLKSGSISMEKKAAEEKKEIKTFGIWEEAASEPDDYMLKPPANTVQGKTKTTKGNTLNFVSDRVIKMNPSNPHPKNPVYELFSERNESKDDKFNAYNMTQNGSKTTANRGKKQTSMTGFGNAFTKKTSDRMTSQKILDPKLPKQPKQSPVKTKKQVSPVQQILDQIESNLKEAMDSLDAVRRDPCSIRLIPYQANVTSIDTRQADEEFSPVNAKKSKPFFASKGMASRGLIKANSMTANFESREPLEYASGQNGETSRGKPSIISKALDMNSKRGVSNYTKLFLS